MARDIRKRAKGKGERTGRGRDREDKAVSIYRRGRSLWRVKRRPPTPHPTPGMKMKTCFDDISVFFLRHNIPESSLHISNVRARFRLPSPSSFVDHSALLSPWLVPLLVSSSPWQVAHSSGNPNISGPPTQSKFHL